MWMVVLQGQHSQKCILEEAATDAMSGTGGRDDWFCRRLNAQEGPIALRTKLMSCTRIPEFNSAACYALLLVLGPCIAAHSVLTCEAVELAPAASITSTWPHRVLKKPISIKVVGCSVAHNAGVLHVHSGTLCVGFFRVGCGAAS